jgi:Protein of unknown function (DUF3987)
MKPKFDPERAAGAEAFEGWPDPIPLRDELAPVLPFTADLLPRQLRPWVVDIAERMNCPPDLVAIPAMVAAGSLVGRRVGIRPQRRTDWTEVGNLWGCVVARPGNLKSPAASEALAPLRRLEASAAEQNQAALAKHKAAEAVFKLQREVAERTARNAFKSMRGQAGHGEALAAFEALAEPQGPPLKRFLTSDVTVEKLGEMCADNPDGLLIYRDELLSLFTDLDNPEQATARSFFLTGWGGADSYTFDRIMRGTVRVSAVNLSLCGTTQPNRLAGYIRDSLKRYDDGMVQRLQLLAWPDFSPDFREIDRYPDSEARHLAHECYADLASLDVREIGAEWDSFAGTGAVPFLRFSDEAQEGFSEWRTALERRVRGDELPAQLSAHLSKYRGLIPRLALICHLANGGSGTVSLEAAGQSWRWADYLESHARRAYASLSLDNAEAARAIWRKLAKGDLAAPFTARQIQRKGWTGLTGKERVASGLAALVDADWLAASATETGGRPSIQFIPNPKAMNG